MLLRGEFTFQQCLLLYFKSIQAPWWVFLDLNPCRNMLEVDIQSCWGSPLTGFTQVLSSWSIKLRRWRAAQNPVLLGNYYEWMATFYFPWHAGRTSWDCANLLAKVSAHRPLIPAVQQSNIYTQVEYIITSVYCAWASWQSLFVTIDILDRQ